LEKLPSKEYCKSKQCKAWLNSYNKYDKPKSCEHLNTRRLVWYCLRECNDGHSKISFSSRGSTTDLSWHWTSHLLKNPWQKWSPKWSYRHPTQGTHITVDLYYFAFYTFRIGPYRWFAIGRHLGWHCKTRIQHSGATAQEFDTDIF
jgi:hypothetical protein